MSDLLLVLLVLGARAVVTLLFAVVFTQWMEWQVAVLAAVPMMDVALSFMRGDT